MRIFTPLLFFGTAAYVGWYNGQHTDRVLALPFVDLLVPSTAGDPRAMGEASIWIMAGLGVAFLAWDLVMGNRRKQKGSKAVEDEDD